MKATLIQMDLAWADPEENVRKADEFIDANPGADLYVLPEMFTTGFSTTPDGCIEEEPSPSLMWMKAKAAEKDCAIVGSIAVHTREGRNANRLYFVKPDGDVTVYDKRHLFIYGGEGVRFSPGNRREIVEWRGFRILLIVCYDIRFPVWLRNREDYDAIVCCANWPMVRRLAWDTMTRTRAVENQCYVLAANRIGEDPTCSYNGGSYIFNPYGEIMAEGIDGKECVLTAELSLEKVRSYNAKFPLHDYADDFTINL